MKFSRVIKILPSPSSAPTISSSGGGVCLVTGKDVGIAAIAFEELLIVLTLFYASRRWGNKEARPRK